jgi:cell division protein FtsA
LNQELNIMGVSRVPSRGVRKGQIVDIESTARCVEECIAELERLTGVEVYHAMLGFSGISVNAINNHAVVAVGNPSYEITLEDKERVLQSARNIALPSDKAIIQTIERQYVVDGFEGIKDPVGMVGSRLEAEATILVAATAAVQNLQRSASRINLHINGIVYNPLLACEAVLSHSEKELGVILVDIGAGKTEISHFQEGNMFNTAVLPFGDEYITRDLAIVLRTSMGEAARIKEVYGVANPDLSRDDLLIEVKNLHGKDVDKRISQRVVAEIISARVMEMTEMISTEIKQFDNLEQIPGGIVLTGGGAELQEISSFMEDGLNIPVRPGIPENIRGVPNDLKRPQNAAVLGGLLYAARYININESFDKGLPGVFNKINDWLKELFS